MTAWPARIRATSLAAGFCTRRTTSASRYSVSSSTMRAPGVDVRAVRERGAVTGARLDEHLVAGARQLRDGLGHDGDAPLSGRDLLDDGNLHLRTPSLMGGDGHALTADGRARCGV